MDSELQFKIFIKEDFLEYLSWFQDPDLNDQLGPMKEEDEWLTYVLNEQKGLTENDGCTFSIFQNQKLVSVVGIAFPNKKEQKYCITNIAVNPQLTNRGIGKRILKKVVKLYPLKKGQYWIAYVDKNNIKAKLFFEHNGWTCDIKSLVNDDIYLFEYKRNNKKLRMKT
jgi:RimJ/RimL family protein N-acetyltransferase